MILVETFMAHEPIFSVGIPAISIQNFVITTPRFTRKLCFRVSDDEVLCPYAEDEEAAT